MKMWIRSQGKHTLIESKVFQVFDDKKTNVWYIKAINVECERILGKYSTEEKALKVLNQIQVFINSGIGDYVFNMPQDGDGDED